MKAQIPQISFKSVSWISAKTLKVTNFLSLWITLSDEKGFQDDIAISNVSTGSFCFIVAPMFSNQKETRLLTWFC